MLRNRRIYGRRIQVSLEAKTVIKMRLKSLFGRQQSAAALAVTSVPPECAWFSRVKAIQIPC